MQIAKICVLDKTVFFDNLKTTNMQIVCIKGNLFKILQGFSDFSMLQLIHVFLYNTCFAINQYKINLF